MCIKKDQQIELEHLFNKNQTISRIKKEFQEVFDEKGYKSPVFAGSEAVPIDFAITLLTQMALHRRADLTTLIGVMRYMCDTSQEVADLLYECASANIMDYNTKLKVFIVKWEISEDVQQELDMYQYPLPMIIKPIEVKSNTETGYIYNKGSIILRDNHHDNDVCLDHINKANSVKFSLNHQVAHMIKNTWKSLDKNKEGETKEDYEKRCRAFEKYDRTALDVMNLLAIHDNEFYLTHRYDKRGRVYAQGYHVNYQGNPWNKAVIELADKEIIE